MHVTHGFHILCLTVVKFLLQLDELFVQLSYVTVKHINVTPYGVDSLALVGYLGIDNH